MQLLRQDMASLFVSEGQDWSSKAIIAALDRQGVSLSDLENELGVGKNAIRNVFYRKCGRYEEAIAKKIGVSPSMIWPSRYFSDSRLTA
ncbi:helix-turn-helix domain-containing protein [Citrobacter freundii]|uniref:helix-turn-helix domain-containing protein n=1 Tax=Citrobacter freundii TaxID=546 RepID=UPI0024E08639|nr:helix-turn-helix domain-containing protein [Citrobacter freundii]WOR38667.1 helix-turn-helix domain-containing protein [Citrobacter freundii]HEE9861332.1 helix-turn-helix domain-containing protein [Citrobacter freundii]